VGLLPRHPILSGRLFNSTAKRYTHSRGFRPPRPAESTLGSHPCVALSSAQVLPEWINRTIADHRFAANGDNPINFVSHSRGSLQFGQLATRGTRLVSVEGRSLKGVARAV
jgi:hypothetical protein